MTKVGLTILKVLNDKNVDTPSKAFSVNQVISFMEEKQRKSYSTVYRHLFNMEKQGYVGYGLIDGLASTYYITDSGKSFCKAQY